MSEVPTITMIEPEAAGFLTVADDLAGALQDEGKMASLLARVEEQARALVPDVTTAKGRAAVKSNAHKVVRSRGAIQEAGLALTERWRMQTKATNAVRDAAKAKLEVLENEVRAPLDEWERAEDARKERLDALLQSLRPMADRDCTSAEILAERDRIKGVEIDETWEEVADAGRERQREALATLERDRKVAVDREEQQAEIRRMSAEIAERKAAEAAAEEASAKEREESARRQAEESKAAAAALKAAEDRAAAAERAYEEARVQAHREREAAAAAEEQRAAQYEEERAQDLLTRSQARARMVEALGALLPPLHPGDVGEVSYAEIVADEIVAGRIPHARFEP